MSIKLGSNFDVQTNLAIDSRIVLKTYAEMKAINDATQPNVYFALCEQDSSLYLYNKSNTVDATTGKFRKFEGGLNIWQGTKDEYEAQKDTIPPGTLIVITDDDEENAMIHWVGTSAQWAAEDKTKIPDGTVVIITDAQGENPVVTTWSSTPSNTNIPSEKLVKTSIDSINSNLSSLLSNVKIKKIATVMAASTTSQVVGGNETITIDLTPYGFTKTPKAFLVGTYVNTAMVTALTTTQMKVQLINVYTTARADMKAQYHLIEFE